jgi:catechol 2,3-dioxygenase-like lactoylglutathione lyase family enzyme
MVDAWAKGIGAVTLFVEDLAAARRFYNDALGLAVHFEDEESVVFAFGDLLVNLLDVAAAPELIAPRKVAPQGAGVRMQLTVEVDDIDDAVSRLRTHGVELLNGPLDRPWGMRTAAFCDPAGHVWELGARIG